MSSSAILKITARHARSFTLARQGLTALLSSPVEAARRLVAIQSQYLTSVPHSICARSTGTTSADVENAIRDEHSLVRTWCLRGTVHTLAAIDQFNVAEGVSYISTGGGAFLEYVEGKTLPAVAALEKRF